MVPNFKKHEEPNMSFLKGKTAIITGAGYAVLSDGRCGSIGYGIATAYAKEGANLVITGRNVAKLEKAKEELERLYGIRVLALSADISEGADNETIAKGVAEAAMKAILLIKAQHEGAVTPRCIVQKNPQVPHSKFQTDLSVSCLSPMTKLLIF